MWEVDKNVNLKNLYFYFLISRCLSLSDGDDHDDIWWWRWWWWWRASCGGFSQSTYNVTSQTKPIFFRNIGHFRNRRVESINNSSVWPPPSIHLVTRRGAMLSVGKASINFSNRSKPFRFYLFLSILLLNRWDEGLGETEVHKKKWKSGLKNSSRS